MPAPRGVSHPGRKGAGRPKGAKNKVLIDIKNACQMHGEAMIAELVRLAGAAESESARVAAAKEVLDRGYGKASQTIAGDPDAPLVVHTVKRIIVDPANPDPEGVRTIPEAG